MIWAGPSEVPPGKKRCGRCKEFVPVGEFGKNSNKKDGLQANCKPCRVLDNASSYVRTKGYQNPKRRATAAVQVERNRKIVLDYLTEHPCVDCGESDLVVLQFDHQGDKAANVSTLITRASAERLLAEIAKCHVVCANCHTRRTARQFAWWRLSPAVVG